MKHSHCSYCGSAYTITDWPRHCLSCNETTWRNPLPVVVVLVPIYESVYTPGVIVVRRGIQPGLGLLAFPGGYLECDETWREGGSRELREETGIEIDPDSLVLQTVISSKTNSLLIFCEAPPQSISCTHKFVANYEVTELISIEKPVELAFPSHTDVLRWYFDGTLSFSKKNTPP